jgi:hypothetical protein
VTDKVFFETTATNMTMPFSNLGVFQGALSAQRLQTLHSKGKLLVHLGLKKKTMDRSITMLPNGQIEVINRVDLAALHSSVAAPRRNLKPTVPAQCH